MNYINMHIKDWRRLVAASQIKTDLITNSLKPRKNKKYNTEALSELSSHHKTGVFEWLQTNRSCNVIRFAFQPKWLLSHFCPAHCKHFRTIKLWIVIPWRRNRWRRVAFEMDCWKEGWRDARQKTQTWTWIETCLYSQHTLLAVIKMIF